MIGVFIGGSIASVLFILWLWVERWHLILPGTLPTLKWLGFKRALAGGVHGIWYGRHITSYLNFLGTMARKCGPNGKFARWLENTYHGKILPTELAKCIIGIEENIPLQDVGTEVIPYERARVFVINTPLDIVITQCGCKELSRRKGDPCKLCDPPFQTCMLIGKPLTDFLLDHKPDTSRRITREEALELLDKFHQAGLVHTAWFKDCVKDQFYVICNCCSCCCLGFSTQRMGINQFISSGFITGVNEKRCEVCNHSEKDLALCPFGANELTIGKCIVNKELCMGCGVCLSRCPHEARSLIPDKGRGRPLDVRKLFHRNNLCGNTESHSYP